jgi:arginine N-succinyltransferase
MMSQPASQPLSSVIGSANPIVVRPVDADDADELLYLAGLLDTLNLPRDQEAIASIIATSQTSFAALGDLVAATSDSSVAGARMHTLVAVQQDHVLGTASLLSHHGTPDDPHYYLRVVEHTFHSKQLGTQRTRRLLRLEHDETPWTEFGGLVVHPEARGRGIGKLLLAARLLLVTMHAAQFCTRFLAELLPPRRSDGGNAFWDALGSPLTGLNYYRADLLCRSNKEFIEALFPHHEIVLELLPEAAQGVVGEVGPTTLPARRMFERVGFHYLGTVDPFDGGPHYGAQWQDIEALQRSHRLVCLDDPPIHTHTHLLLGNPLMHRFTAAPCQVQGHGMRLYPDTAEELDLHAGELVWCAPLDW